MGTSSTSIGQSARRAVFWALTGGALARLYVLGEERSWALVGPVAIEITSLTVAAWLLHVVVHEGGHALATWPARFQLDGVGIGPLQWNARERRWAWAGLSLSGRVSTLPIGTDQLARRLRWVALGGPLASLLATLALGALWLKSGKPVTTPLGIGAIVGTLVLVSAATPGKLRASTATAGNDVDQVLGARWVLAHWTYLAVVQGVLAGQRLREALGAVDAAQLVPGPTDTPSGITLIAAVQRLERGEVAWAKALLTDAARRTGDAPSWVQTDVFHQLGAIAALIDRDEARALECLAEVRRHQTLPWYQHLLEACVAKAQGDEVMARQRVEGWSAAAAAAPGGRLALAGNEWILERLDAP